MDFTQLLSLIKEYPGYSVFLIAVFLILFIAKNSDALHHLVIPRRKKIKDYLQLLDNIDKITDTGVKKQLEDYINEKIFLLTTKINISLDQRNILIKFYEKNKQDFSWGEIRKVSTDLVFEENKIGIRKGFWFVFEKALTLFITSLLFLLAFIINIKINASDYNLTELLLLLMFDIIITIALFSVSKEINIIIKLKKAIKTM